MFILFFHVLRNQEVRVNTILLCILGLGGIAILVLDILYIYCGF